jgi:hypothetical protein
MPTPDGFLGGSSMLAFVPRMARRLKTVRATGLFCALAMLAAASTGCAANKPTRTGFLSDYSRLTPTEAVLNWAGGRHKVMVNVPSLGELDGIDSFYVKPVAWLAPEDDWLGHNTARRDRVTAALDQSLRSRLGKIRPIVEEPGPRTATVSAAVTDISSARPVINSIASIFFGPITNGGASVEAEIKAPDGRQIAAVDGGSTGGGTDIIGYYTRSGHGKKAVGRLAGELSDALDAAVLR